MRPIIAAYVLGVASAACGSKSGGPTDVPTVSQYGAGAYPWAENMTQWTCVYNIKDFTGDADAAFASAQAAAVANGGGVVYFPAGTYAFAKNLTLANGVVIRGVPTTAPAKSGKNPGTLSPQTKFTCPDRLHQGVWNIDPSSNNMGIINVELAGCAVMLWPALVTPPGWNFETYWFFATGVLGMGSNKIVMGCKVHDVSYGHSSPANPSGSNPYPWVFSTAIAVYTDSNALVANNLLSPAESPSTQVTLDLKERNGSSVKPSVTYPYDNRYGIDVNQVILGGAAGHASGTSCPAGSGTLTPACFPSGFRPGITIRDNYVFQNGRVGIAWSGGPKDEKTVGGGTQVVNNHVEVASGTTCWTVDGVHITSGSDTNENRGYNQQGYGSNVTLNTGRIHRQLVPYTPYETVDGEGILMQAANAGSGYYGVWDRNDLTGGESGYIAYYDLPMVQDCIITNNVVNSDQFIGGVLIAAGDQWSSNKCSGNTPAATVCNNGKCQPC